MGKRYRLQDGSAFFITTTAYKHQTILRSEQDYNLVLKSLKFCLDKYEVVISAFVLMPNHVHFILWQEKGFDLSSFMRDFKRFTSVQLRKRLVEQFKDTPFVIGLSKSGRKKYMIWQSRFDVVPIRNEELLRVKTDYIHNNPVKKHFVEKAEDWKWSSARFYIKGEDAGLPVRWIG